MLRKTSFASLLAVALLILVAPASWAQAVVSRFDLPAQSLAAALRALGSQTSTNVLFDPPLVEGRDAPALRMEMTLDQAFARILVGTGLKHRFLDDKTVMVISAAAAIESVKPTSDVPEVGLMRLAHQAANPQNQSSPDSSNQAQDEKNKKNNSFASSMSSDAEENKLHEIIVSARKRNEDAQSVPISIGALDSEQLRDLGIAESKDIGRVMPGVQWKTNGPFSANSVFVRGVGNNNTTPASAPAVAVYSDETFLNSQAFQGFALYDLSRVEVLKGPQGTLYGRNTTGGAVKFVSRKPRIGESTTGDINLDLGNFTARRAEGGISAPLGVNAALRLSFLTYERGGIYYDYINDDDVVGIDAKALRVQLLVEPTESFSILLNASYGRSRSEGVLYKRVDTVDPTSISGFGFSRRCPNPGIGTAPGCTSLLSLVGVPDEMNTDAFEVQTNLSHSQNLERIDTWGTSVTLTYDFGPVALTSATSYYSLDVARPQDVDGVVENIVSVGSDAEPSQYSQELRLESNADGAFRWLVGAYYFHEDIEQLRPTNIAALGSGSGSAAKQKTDSFALFAEGVYNITDLFELTVGGRWSRDDRDVDFTFFRFVSDGSEIIRYRDIVAGPGFAPGSFTLDNQEESWSDFSGRIILSYTLAPDFLIYGSASRGFKGGEFNFGANRPDTATFVDPEEVDAFELGLKSEFLDNRLRFNTAVFYYDYKDKQEILFDTGTAVLSNADASVKGVDIEVVAVPYDGLWLNAGLTLLDSEYEDFDFCLADGTNCTGNRLPSAPKQMFTFLARHEFNIGGRTASLQGSTTYTSKRYFDFRNVDYIASKDYWLFDARASYEVSDSLVVSIWAQNIANKRYFENGFDVSSFGYSLLQPGIPRTYGGSFSFKF